MTIRLARVREPGGPDGYRVLCDRLWPRGLSRTGARLDLWAKELAPTADLRRWYHADPDTRYDEFCRRHRAELDRSRHDELLASLRQVGDLVLLTDGRDVDRSQLPTLQEWLRHRL